MDIMYVKYNRNQRCSIIKEGEKIIMNNSKIIPFEHIKKIKETKSFSDSHNKNNSRSNTKIDEEITNFFFNSIHKNYLLNRMK